MRKFSSSRRAAVTYRFFMRLVGFAVCVAALLSTAGNARANILCSWFGRCFYESPGFKIRVLDKETGKPLADVHALAEWDQYGYHGGAGPIMVQDSVSDADGWFAFPPWGPIRGSSAGLRIGYDPEVTLYHAEYTILELGNYGPRDEKASVRGFSRNGQTFVMEKFKGTADGRIKQLERIYRGRAFPRSEEQSRLFRDPYVNRLQRVWAERQKFSEHQEPAHPFFSYVHNLLKTFLGEQR